MLEICVPHSCVYASFSRKYVVRGKSTGNPLIPMGISVKSDVPAKLLRDILVRILPWVGSKNWTSVVDFGWHACDTVTYHRGLFLMGWRWRGRYRGCHRSADQKDPTARSAGPKRSKEHIRASVKQTTTSLTWVELWSICKGLKNQRKTKLKCYK